MPWGELDKGELWTTTAQVADRSASTYATHQHPMSYVCPQGCRTVERTWCDSGPMACIDTCTDRAGELPFCFPHGTEKFQKQIMERLRSLVGWYATGAMSPRLPSPSAQLAMTGTPSQFMAQLGRRRRAERQRRQRGSERIPLYLALDGLAGIQTRLAAGPLQTTPPNRLLHHITSPGVERSLAAVLQLPRCPLPRSCSSSGFYTPMDILLYGAGLHRRFP